MVKYGAKLDKSTMIEGAFRGATDLPQDFVIPSFVTRVERAAFAAAVLPQAFSLPDSVMWMGNNVFYKTNVPASFRILKGLKEIGAPDNR